jgi:hypothetical protein
MHESASRSTLRLLAISLLLLLLAPAQSWAASITVRAHHLNSDGSDGALLQDFTYIVNDDNANDPDATDPLNRPSIAPTQSNTPIVAEGDQARPTVDLPDGRYLISIRSPHHKLWGKHIRLPQDAGNVDIALREGPFPLGKIRIFVFDDSQWTNAAPDSGEAGLEGFHVTLEEQTASQVTVDYNNDPLCRGDCLTESDGFVEIDNLGPATYFAEVTPPDSCGPGGAGTWVQTSTFDGGFHVQTGVEEGSDGTGAPGEALWEPPDRRTGYFFGFVCTATDFPNAGSGSIIGRAANWVGWPLFDNLIVDGNQPVENPYVALSDTTTDTTVFVGQGDADGNFSIPNVPAGSYMLSIWDEQLTYIIRFMPVTVTAAGAGHDLDLGEVGVSRWFGWLSGDVYFDNNKNGVRDAGEPPIPNTDLDQRWRDGSIKEDVFTNAAGHYEYRQAEGGPLGKFYIGEVGFARFGTSGAAVHDEYDPSIATHVPTDIGGGLLTNQLSIEGHRSEVDWGKYQYGNEPGQIVGITYWATTRNEFDAKFQAHENYEPGIPDVTVLLEAEDGTVLNEYVTDHWSPTSDCDVRNAFGADVSADVNPLIGSKCLEVPITGPETKDGAFDGGYAFADYCPVARGGFDHGTGVCGDGGDPDPLVSGTYVVHAIMPKDPSDARLCNPVNSAGHKNISGPDGTDGGHGCLYRPVREEDVNVDLGNEFIPAIPPPDCAGDMHVIDQSTLVDRSPYFGVDPSPSRPLCDKRTIVLNNKQNANADFFMMTNQRTEVDVQEPGRIIGLVADDIYFDRDQKSIWYGEARPVGNIPIGVRDYNWRLITTTKTDVNGSYEVLLPSTETFNCPIPQGPCPGMYIVVVNDPGDKAHPNLNYNPNYLTAQLAWDVWPGLTTQLDTPLDPIAGTGCELSLTTPELLQVSKPGRPVSEQGPFVRAADTTPASRRITIDGDFFGTTPGSVTLSDPRGALQSRTFTGVASAATLSNVNNGGIVSWSNRQIVVQVPATQVLFLAGQKQLSIRTAGANGVASTNGITMHVLGTGYNPQVIVAAPPSLANPHALQNAINAANAIASPPTPPLVVLRAGVYQENVVVSKPIKLQGLGPGGIVGAAEFQDRQPDDPRFNIQGTTIDGRFFKDNEAAWDATVNALPPLAGVNSTHPVLRGADITVVARSETAFNIGSGAGAVFDAARIDGIGITTGHGEGAGGIQAQAHINNLQMTNDVLESNGGVLAGGIGLGQPYYDSHNFNARVQYTRVLGSGGLMRAGGIGIFRNSTNYEIADSVLCSNFSIVYGAGITHWGRSPGGSIHDNKIYYNDSVDSGAGITISHETPQPLPDGSRPLGDGSGPVDIDRNLIQSNYSGDDGGGIFVQNGKNERINIRTNLIVDNGAADMGGAILLDDSSNVAIVNNTVANNVSTGSAEDSDGNPHSAGLASEANDPLFQATLPGTAPKFSNPVALFNNIFWNNEAFTLSQPGPGATLDSQGFLDFEVHGTCTVNPSCASDRYTPRYSLMTNGNLRGADGATQVIPGGGAPITGFPTNPAQNGNVTGVDPLFVTPFILELAVAGSRLDPQTAAVTITGQDPPVGLTGDYHLQPALGANQISGAVDRGVHCSNTPVPPPANPLGACPAGGIEDPILGTDIDGQLRPQLRTLRTRTPWDFGADERPTLGAG